MCKNLTAPFDLVAFPSMGLFYENKKSFVLVKYLTGIEENILTSPMLNEYDLAMDMALKSLILDDDINVDDLLVGDKNAILLFLRATSFGTNFEVQIVCPKCNQAGKTSFDISEMTAKEIEILPDDMGFFTYVMPKMKLSGESVVIKFRPMTYSDEKKIIYQDKIYQKKNKGISIYNTLRYVNQIVSVNEIVDKDKIELIVKKMPIKDSVSLRSYMDRVEPDIDTLVSLKCNHCQNIIREDFKITNQFLGFTPEYKNVIWEESFLLGYYGQGSINRDETFTMATAERKWRIQRIEEELQKKQEAEKKAQESANRGRRK
jgi:hypothetical protein